MSAGHSPEARMTVFKRDGWTCRGCGFRQTNDERLAAVEAVHAGTGTFDRWLTIDHIVPWSIGGSHRLENLQTLCNVCNAEKDNRCDPDDIIPIRLRKKFKAQKKPKTRLVHDPRCDLDYCMNTCPVYLERGVYV